MRKEDRVYFRNVTQRIVVLALEPWAHQYSIQPGIEVELRRIDADDTLELEYGSDRVTVFSGGVVTVFLNGEEMSPEFERK